MPDPCIIHVYSLHFILFEIGLCYDECGFFINQDYSICKLNSPGVKSWCMTSETRHSIFNYIFFAVLELIKDVSEIISIFILFLLFQA